MRRVGVAGLLASGLAVSLMACGGGGRGGPAEAPGGGSASGPGAQLNVGLAYDIGGRGDQSFNDAAAAGLDKAKQELGVGTKELEAGEGETGAAKEERLRLLASGGFNPIIAVGFVYQGPLQKVAAEFPDTWFALVDSTAEGKNVAGLTFADNQGSFLVGAAAALKSKKNGVGMVGGVQVPLIQKFEAGYVAGAKHVRPNIKVEVKYLSQPPDFSGFADPAKGKVAAKGIYDGGADVVYQVAGGSGSGVFEAAKEAGAMAIGVDSDQAKTAAPAVRDVIITSMVKRVDVAVFDFIESVSNKTVTAGQKVYDLKANGVDYATTGGHIDDIKPQLEDLKKKIINGQITVP
ncbi:BMP family protein [Streptosporangium sp. NPDC000396]|uniref:BMP family lipoprotein n=1 Tax=Streptosporangium sp. NPDC000396 TaxID=3366185 RepID=UPI0036CF85FE